jgi:hypothetical protein
MRYIVRLSVLRIGTGYHGSHGLREQRSLAVLFIRINYLGTRWSLAKPDLSSLTIIALSIIYEPQGLIKIVKPIMLQSHSEELHCFVPQHGPGHISAARTPFDAMPVSRSIAMHRQDLRSHVVR